MNQSGLDFIQDVNRQSKGKKFPVFSRSQIIERAMRCGRECRMYETRAEEEIEQIALATLREDFLNHL